MINLDVNYLPEDRVLALNHIIQKVG